MLDADMVRSTRVGGTGCGRVGSSSGAAGKRHDGCWQLIVDGGNGSEQRAASSSRQSAVRGEIDIGLT